MRIFRYILGLAMSIAALSCSMTEIGTDDPAGRNDLIQVVPRVASFGDFDPSAATTKANKTDEEQKITSMTMAIFDDDGACINFQYDDSDNPTYLIDRETLNEVSPGKLAQAKIYVFANIPEMASLTESEWKGKPLSYFLSMETEVTGVGIPADGFPMYGAYDSDPSDNLGPTVDLTPQKALAKPLLAVSIYSTYAKFIVNLTLDSDLEMGQPSFNPSNWAVHNLCKIVDCDSTDVETSPSVYDTEIVSSRFTGTNGTIVQGNNKVSFSFYLPERLINPGNSYEYPFLENGEIREEDKVLRQRYKPKFVTDAQKATFIRLTGDFTDHQGRRRTVLYDIYVGENNYDDFNVRGNVLYTNDVTIKSVSNSSDPEFENTISYDGRVHTSDESFSIKFERETLLDSHWEVRPLRVHVLEGKLRIEIADAANNTWIRMENASEVPDDSEDHLLDANSNSYGKRKYFTVNLLNEISGNTSYELGPGDHCIWLYIDEYVNTEDISVGGKSIPSGADAVREADINILYYDKDGNPDPQKSYIHTIAQRQLYPVRYTSADSSRDTIYNIEYHEEYLYNFDALDGFGQTEYEGMPWGLDRVQLSSKYDAMFLKEQSGLLGSIIKWVVELITSSGAAKYDFYLKRDNPQTGSTVRSDRIGRVFTKEIIEAVNSDNDATNDIGALTLDQNPASAVEYCYNKNKRNDNGEVVALNWYLPAIDEMEEIAVGGYSQFDVFQDKRYWSSMPSYKRSYVDVYGSNYGDFYVDHTQRARATKVAYNGTEYTYVASGVVSGKYSGYLPAGFNVDMDDYVSIEEDATYFEPGNRPRAEQNRVRCVYKP